jgi:hypothetical protein
MMQETASLGVAAMRGTRFGNATTEETGAAAAVPAPAQLATRGAGTYMSASLLGAGLGGALIGFVASSDFRGAYTGAAFSIGAAGICDAFILRRSGAGLGVVALSSLIGIAGLGGAVWLATKR